MTVGTHIITGLIIGKVTGSYSAALVGALVVDVDHLIPYIKHKVLFNIKKLWKTITNPNDPYGDQRNYLHSLFTFIPISVVTYFLVDINIAITFSLGYLSHLILDALDGSDFYPFYPIKSKIKGPIEYLSKAEFILFIILLAVFLLL